MNKEKNQEKSLALGILEIAEQFKSLEARAENDNETNGKSKAYTLRIK